MLEKEIKNKILNWLLHQPGVFAFVCPTTGIWDAKRGFWRTSSKRGIPDILCCAHGRFIGIEVKTPTGRLRPDQKDFAEAFQLAGGMFILARSLDDVKAEWYNIANG